LDPLAGKALERELIGYRSYAIPPHRIIYRVDSSGRTVRVFLVEHRKDVYEILVQKLNSGEVRERRAIYVHR
jgi:mRNA-degrading endonuclease RelE of RelBE toxin-antitoxin system